VVVFFKDFGLMGEREYTVEQAYRKSVRPLAVFFALFGFLFFVGSLVDGDHIHLSSLIQSDLAKRTLCGVIGILCMFIGLGLNRRSRLAWYMMFAYINFGTAFFVLAIFLADDMNRGLPPLAEATLAIAFNGVIGVGLYFVTRPVFNRGSRVKPGP
jgi:hypothetical protein